jgi:protein involved in polysaccharide export with SLBB domain
MKKRCFLPYALLWLAVPPAILSQSMTGNASGQSQQDTAVNCADSLSPTGEGCAQDQQQNQQQSPQQPALDEPGMAMPRSLGTAAAENTPLGRQPRAATQQQAPVLPPSQPTEFQKFVAATTGQLLPVFGESLFRNVPSTFAPVDLAPVPANYVIGPEDELRVHIWGQINYSGNVRVDRSGDIYLPQIGNVPVAGLQFSALDQHLRQAVGRIYRNFDLSADMGRIRSIQIYVTGQAQRPGVYTVSSLSSLVDALFASGGPSPQGSLRHILVNRDGKTLADFDLYALLIHGDKSKDVRLQAEDVLYFPTSGPQVAITGSIRNPGIYELNGAETIGDLIDMAGKTTAMASGARISLDRVDQRQYRQAMEFGFDAAGLAAPLDDGDILRISPIVPAYEKTVTLRGNLANPGRFGWRPGMHLSDLIPDRDSLLNRDYWWKRSHLGLPSPEFEPMISTIGRDQQNPESTSQGLTNSVSQESLTSALTPDAQRPAGTATLGAAQAATNGSIASQLARDPDADSPGRAKRVDVRLSAPEIDWDYAVIERLDPETLKTSLIPFDLGKLVLNHDASQDLPLQPGDTITIFSQGDIHVPLERRTKYVDLEGEFVHAGIYSVQPGESLRDLVRRAGGFTQKAYLYGAEFTRESTRLLQQQRIDEYARTMSLDAQRGTQALAMSSTSSAGAADVAASRLAAQDISTRLSQIRATGRIVLNFRPDSASIEDVPALNLENGDRFLVSFTPETINVVGAVYDQNSFLFDRGQPVARYLQLAGGPDRNADRRHSFVIRADGSVVSREATKGTGAWPNSFSKLRLNPGDTIVVPEKTLRPNGLRGLIDWTQIFSQLALGAAAINVL